LGGLTSNGEISNDLSPVFQGHAIIRRRVSQKRHKIDTWFLQTSNRKWYVAWTVPLPMTLIHLEGHFRYYKWFHSLCVSKIQHKIRII